MTELDVVETTPVDDLIAAPSEAERVALAVNSGPLAIRIRERLAASSDVSAVVDVDPLVASIDDLAASLRGADVLIVSGTAVGSDLDGTGGCLLDLDATGRLISASRSAGLRRLVIISSAMVYGAWHNSPVPITEVAPLRPVPELAYAVAKAEIERQVEAWRSDDPSVVAAVLRPAVVVDPQHSRWFARSPWGRVGSIISSSEAHRQFVHVDDLVEAVEVARSRHLDGPFNVAPNGWLAPDARRDLDGLAPNLAILDRLVSLSGRIRSWFGLSPIPHGLNAYVKNSWVVANDRLKAAGWEPKHTNEEVYIEAIPQGRLAAMGVRRRQELSLAALGAVVLAVAGAVLLFVRRQSRRRLG